VTNQSRLRRRRQAVRLLLGGGFIALVGILAQGFSTGPLPGFTGAPGENTCTECHDEFGEETNTGSGALTLTHPSRYEPGQRMTITVELSAVGQRRWGMQVTALTIEGAIPAGEFVLTDPVHTQLIQGPTGRTYVEHTTAGTFFGQRDRITWTFDWIAPPRDVGPVAFYATGNAANGDGTRLGDWIYSAQSVIAPPSFPGVTLLSPRGGEVLSPGERFPLRWTATPNAVSFTLLYFPRPGALPETIVADLPSHTRSYGWTVPETVTLSARVAVVAFNEKGSGFDESDLPIAIARRSSRVRLIQPLGSPVATGGDLLPITWQVAPDVLVRQQQLRLSLDGGRTYPIVLASSVGPLVRRFEWQIPSHLDTPSARLLLLVEDQQGDLLADESDSSFTIAGQR
jgi:hypothetical protein